MDGYGRSSGGGRSGGGYGGFGPSTAPVKVGEELEVTIEAVGEKGDGIAKKNGFVLFVPGVKAGDHVRIKVTKVLRKVGFAEVVGSGGSASGEQQEAPVEGSGESGSEEATEEVAEEESSTGDSEEF